MVRIHRNKYQSAASEYCNEAIFSLIIGVFSIVGVFLLGSGATLGGFGLGIAYIAHRDIKKSRRKGRKLMVSGIVCSLIGIVSSFIW